MWQNFVAIGQWSSDILHREKKKQTAVKHNAQNYRSSRPNNNDPGVTQDLPVAPELSLISKTTHKYGSKCEIITQTIHHTAVPVFHVSYGCSHLGRLVFKSADHVHFMLQRTLHTLYIRITQHSSCINSNESTQAGFYRLIISRALLFDQIKIIQLNTIKIQIVNATLQKLHHGPLSPLTNTVRNFQTRLYASTLKQWYWQRLNTFMKHDNEQTKWLKGKSSKTSCVGVMLLKLQGWLIAVLRLNAGTTSSDKVTLIFRIPSISVTNIQLTIPTE